MEADNVVINILNLAGAFLFAYMALEGATEAFQDLSRGDLAALILLPFSALFGFLSIACLSAIRDNLLEEA